MKTIINRINEPTPTFFKKLRNIGLGIVTIGTTIVTVSATLPVALPAVVLTVASYLIAGGMVASAVAQLTSKDR